MSATKSTNRVSGYTIIELLMAIILSGIVVSVFISTLMTMMRTATLQKIQLELSQKNQISLDVIERDIRLAKTLATTVPSTTPASFSDPYGPTNTNEGWSGTWTYKGTGTDSRVLILQQSATAEHPLRASKSPVYIRGFETNPYAPIEPTFNCTAYNSISAPTGALTYNPILPYYVIYFVRDGNLYRRTLTDTTTNRCNTMYQKQSCPTIDTSRPSACLANDELISENVASFTVTYYNQETTPTPVFTDVNAYSSNDPEVLSEVSNVLVTLRLEKNAYGSGRGATLSVRVSRVN